MSKSHCSPEQRTFTARAPLVAIGIKVHRSGLLQPIFQKVRIAQKKVKFSPTEKLVDALIAMLAGAHGLVEVNKRVRPDIALQRAFGHSGCAEQSVVQDTLDACDAQNVAQMEEAMALIYQKHSRGYRHPYHLERQLLDIDLTGRPCGPKAAFASRGYFRHPRNRQGRQVGYVLATYYEDVVVERVFPGKDQLPTALRPLVEAAERTLGLDEAKRQRTILRTLKPTFVGSNLTIGPGHALFQVANPSAWRRKHGTHNLALYLLSGSGGRFGPPPGSSRSVGR